MRDKNVHRWFESSGNPLSPHFDGVAEYDWELVRRLQEPEVVTEEILFSKLSAKELMEFLDLHDAKYDEYDEGSVKYYLADIAERVFKYHAANDTLQMTDALEDLIYPVDVRKIGRMYDEEELMNMSDKDLYDLATVLEISTEDNVRERVFRLLRMNYLIKYNPDTYVE